jgi:hypothetical protein
MARAMKISRASQRYTTKEFRPYVIALGRLALAWNDLQESLAALFWTLSNFAPEPGGAVNYNPLWIWASLKSDRAQREMLKSVIEHSRHFWSTEKAKKDLIWLVDRANELEDVRNNAIHSPLFAVDKSFWGTHAQSTEKVAPAFWLFHQRAANLMKSTNVLGEFRYCDKAAITLSDYARTLDQALAQWQVANFPWPDRPSLPIRPPKKKPPDPPRQAHHK